MSGTEGLHRSLSRLVAADHDTASTRRMVLLAPLLASLPFALSGKRAQAGNIDLSQTAVTLPDAIKFVPGQRRAAGQRRDGAALWRP